MKSPRKSRHAFTLVEVILSMMVIAVILSVVMKSTNGMLHEGQLTKVEGELNTLKSAVTSYWRHHQHYPPDIHDALTKGTPIMLVHVLPDPFRTDTVNNTYGYVTGSDSAFGDYFAIYTRGPLGDTAAPVWDSANQRFTYTGGGRVVSNAPAIRTTP